MASSAIRYGCQREMKTAPTTGSANTTRNIGFCRPPACCQMKPMTDDAERMQRAEQRAHATPCAGRPGAETIENATCTPPSASSPSDAAHEIDRRTR